MPHGLATFYVRLLREGLEGEPGPVTGAGTVFGPEGGIDAGGVG
jgi:hypothetical protein